MAQYVIVETLTIMFLHEKNNLCPSTQDQKGMNRRQRIIRIDNDKINGTFS